MANTSVNEPSKDTINVDELGEGEAMKRKEERERLEDEANRREMARNRFKSHLSHAFADVYSSGQKSSSHQALPVNAISSLLSSRDEQEFKVLSLALSRICYIRRNFTTNLMTDLLIEWKILNDDQTLGVDWSSCPYINLFAKLLPLLPTQDLILPPDDLEVVGAAAEKKKMSTDASQKDKATVDKTNKETKPVQSDTSTANKEKVSSSTPVDENQVELPMDEMIRRSGWSGHVFISILVMVLSIDCLKAKTQHSLEIVPLLEDLLSLLRPLILIKINEHGVNVRDDLLIARAYYWVMIAHERLAVATNQSRSHYATEEYLEELMHVLRLSSINKSYVTQATVINAILRILIIDKQDWARAASLVKVNQFPEQASRTTAHCRYLFYTAIVTCMNQPTPEGYESANLLLKHAYRKSPTGPRGAGIKLEIVQLMVVTDLLLGKTPNRLILNEPEIAPHIQIYKDIARAVHLGHVADFQSLVVEHDAELSHHFSYPIMERHLITAVVRASLIRISKTYSRINLVDVRTKIGMDDRDLSETVSVVAKSICDDILVGVAIDEEGECLVAIDSSVKSAKSSKFVDELLKRRNEINIIQKELREALSTVMDEEIDDDSRLEAAERARKEARESASRAQDAYFDDFDF
eukprot:GHVH01008234.1.p1 GENE.GHVH01008234.1~~GHVH01008234.1.p1  ORF type:complete len:640 (+),score=107.59 GHVH01008234.1:282-2201(+)